MSLKVALIWLVVSLGSAGMLWASEPCSSCTIMRPTVSVLVPPAQSYVVQSYVAMPQYVGVEPQYVVVRSRRGFWGRVFGHCYGGRMVVRQRLQWGGCCE